MCRMPRPTKYWTSMSGCYQLFATITLDRRWELIGGSILRRYSRPNPSGCGAKTNFLESDLWPGWLAAVQFPNCVIRPESGQNHCTAGAQSLSPRSVTTEQPKVGLSTCSARWYRPFLSIIDTALAAYLSVNNIANYLNNEIDTCPEKLSIHRNSR